MLIKIKAKIPLLVIPDLIRNLVFTTLVTWVRLEILKPVVAGFSLRFLPQTRPKGTRLPGVCIKTGNKYDKVGRKGKRPSTYAKIQASADKPHSSPPMGEESAGMVY